MVMVLGDVVVEVDLKEVKWVEMERNVNLILGSEIKLKFWESMGIVGWKYRVKGTELKLD